MIRSCTSRLKVCVFLTGKNSCACKLTAGRRPSSIPVQSLLPPDLPPPRPLLGKKKEKKIHHTHELCNLAPAKVKVGPASWTGVLSAPVARHTLTGEWQRESGICRCTSAESQRTTGFSSRGGGPVVCHPSAKQAAQHSVFIISRAAGFSIRRDPACARQVRRLAGFAGSCLSTEASHKSLRCYSECGGFSGSSG